MKANKLKGLDKRKLRRWLLWFFFGLAIPTAILIQQSYSRLRWETFHQHQLMAEELTNRINRQFLKLINTEEQRPFTDYAFLNVSGEAKANFLQRSPLSQYPIQSEIPGLIGYFQVDAAGKLLTPLIPDNIDKASQYGISGQELKDRFALQNQIQQILAANRLLKNDHKIPSQSAPAVAKAEESLQAPTQSDVSKSLATAEPADALEGQSAFDELKKSAPKSKQQNQLGRLEDLALKEYYQKAAPPAPAESKAMPAAKKQRTETNVLPESLRAANPAGQAAPVASALQTDVKAMRIRTFESEIDPFEFSQLDSGHFVLFRKVWLNKQRYIQGLLIEQAPFLHDVINSAFRETALSQMSDLLVVFQGNVLSAFSGRSAQGYLSSRQELAGELLYQARLSDPLNDTQLLFSITQLPVGSGGYVIIWLSTVLAIVFVGGFFFMYRLGVGQINLLNQQQDFVSAVSHELKTPLTSIRMYGEMLQAGWVDEEKKKTYYQFILDESERLSRLINNILHLAKMTRNEKPPAVASVTVAELLADVQSKVAAQTQRAGFSLNLSCPDEVGQCKINVNADSFIQIMINLVDNAIKFSAKADHKSIDLDCQRLSNGQILFRVRDYGPGIAKSQMKKIFQLFYRSENELTRETVGTGIGLALAQQMIQNMHGQIDVANKQPGAEFRITIPEYTLKK